MTVAYLFIAVLFVLSVAIRWGIQTWAAPRLARQEYRHRRSLQLPVDLEIAVQGLGIRRGGEARKTFTWADPQRWIEGPEDLLVYTSESDFVPIPKGGLAAAELRALGETLAARVPGS